MSNLPYFPRAELDLYEKWIKDGKMIESMAGVLALFHHHRRALDEIDRLRAELDAVRTVIPADFFDSLISEDHPEPIAVRGWGEEVTIEFTADGHAKIGPPVPDHTGPIETMTVDITQDHDVRRGLRRLVELDYAGNVVVEYVEKRP